MAGIKIHMESAGEYTLDSVHRQIHQIPGLELISKVDYGTQTGEVWLLVYEKYYFRTNNYAVLTVLLNRDDSHQTADIIACGGGASISNQSLGANRRLARECVQALEELQFRVDPSRSDEVPKGLLERLIR